MPIFNNVQNQNDWPKVISNDLTRHINNLKNKTHVISGQIKGKTQLPIPAGAEKVTEDDLKMAEKYSKNEPFCFPIILLLFIFVCFFFIKEAKMWIKP